MKSSYYGKILHINLSNNKIWYDILGEEEIKLYLGGRGIGAKLLWDMTDNKTDPLSKENVLIFSTGVLTGTNGPSSGRTTINFKSPLTGRYFKCSVGGGWGLRAKMAGVDHLVTHGKAKKPVYIYISVDKVEIRDASFLLRKSVKETNRILKEKIEDNSIDVACIGPAGESKVKYASIMFSIYNTAARGGSGTVMASKNLKAIVVNPNHGKVYVNDPENFYKYVKNSLEDTYNDSHSPVMYKYGTSPDNVSMFDEGLVASYNFRRQTIENSYNFTGKCQIDEGYLKRRVGCGSCIIGCHRFTVVPSGSFKGTYSEGPELETYLALGARLGITDENYLMKLNEMANDFGFDSISLGSTIAWAMESYEKGLITKKDTNGLEIKWGNGDAVIELIKMIASREGIGDLLAEGTKKASEVIGNNSEEWAVQANGLEQSGVETRAMLSYALAFALNPRGPDHLTTECLAELGKSFSPEAEKIIEKITGDKKYAVPYMTEKRADIVTWHENIYAVSDALGICAFLTTASYGINEEKCAKLFTYATGIKISSDEIMESGRRIVTLERCYNNREGCTRENDVLPKRLMNEIAEGRVKYQPIKPVNSKEILDKMLDDYYELNGWDKKTGYPEKGTLEKLKLFFCADKIYPR